MSTGIYDKEDALGSRCLVMGILNVTPDSFSDGGRYLNFDSALSHATEMIDQGADIIDIGGESTRPGAEPVPEDVELSRVIPLIKELSGTVRISIDTTKQNVALEAVSNGATLINDVSASLEAIAGKEGVGWIAMHSRGNPKTMSQLTEYQDLIGQVRSFLKSCVIRGRECGVDEIYVDPGIGFAKTVDQNLQLIAKIDEIVKDGTPVLLGASRKSFLGNLASWPSYQYFQNVRLTDSTFNADFPFEIPLSDTGTVGPVDRDDASLGVACWAIASKVSIVRVHQVGPAVAASRLI